MSAAMVYFLYAISTGNVPDFTALGTFRTAEACTAAAADVNKALGSAQDPKTALCLSSESLNEMAKHNDLAK